MRTPELQAREIIDQKLQQAGWVIQNPDGMNLAVSMGAEKCGGSGVGK